MASYDCVRKRNGGIAFTYNITTGTPAVDDRIMLNDKELDGESFADREWVIIGREWHQGRLQLIVEPYNGGLVLA